MTNECSDSDNRETPSALVDPSSKRVLERKWLAEHRADYGGKWVVLDGDRLVSVGTNGRDVYEEARRQGIKIPFLARVELLDSLPFGGW